MLAIEGAENEYVDDFADTVEVGVWARGDVYDGNVGVAFYVARWFPERRSEIELLVVLLPLQPSGSQCSLALRYSGMGPFRVVDPQSIWMDWTPHAIPISAEEATTVYPQAHDRAIKVAQLVLAQDPAIREYAQELGT